jgi:hypothetical protein
LWEETKSISSIMRAAATAQIAAKEQGAKAEDPKGPWTQFYVGTKSSCTATELNPGQMYYFRVRALGTSGLSPWSDIAQKRAS